MNARREAMTIFVVFFGITILDAVATHDWWRIAFWILVGGVFLALSRSAENAPKR